MRLVTFFLYLEHKIKISYKKTEEKKVKKLRFGDDEQQDISPREKGNAIGSNFSENIRKVNLDKLQTEIDIASQYETMQIIGRGEEVIYVEARLEKFRR